MSHSKSVSSDSRPHVHGPRGRDSRRWSETTEHRGRRFSSEPPSASRRVNRVSARLRLNPSESRSRSSSRAARTDVEATLRPSSTLHERPTDANENDVTFTARSVENVGSIAQKAIKSYHMVQWEGKKIRISHIVNDGTQIRQSGFTEEDWKKIAEQQVALWDKTKETNNTFAFEKLSFHVDSATMQFRPSVSRAIETIKFNDPALPATYADVRPLALKTQELFQSNLVKIHPLHQIEGNTPRLFPFEQRPHQQPAPLENPVHAPPPAPPEEEGFLTRLGKKIKNLFTRDPDPAPAPAPAPVPVPVPAPAPAPVPVPVPVAAPVAHLDAPNPFFVADGHGAPPPPPPPAPLPPSTDLSLTLFRLDFNFRPFSPIFG